MIKKDAIENIIKRAIRQHFMDVNGREPAMRSVEVPWGGDDGLRFYDFETGEDFIIAVYPTAGPS